MRELIDCHIHTELCGHASGTVAQMVSAAVVRGLSAIVLTEHLALPDELDPHRHLSMPACELSTYADEVRAVAERVRGLEVVLGAEADWLPGHPEAAAAEREAARAAGIGVVLGSVHFIGDWAFDDPHHLEEWERRSVDDAWERYFALWCEAARSGAFDVMAHPDLVKKFGHRPTFDPRDLYVEAASAAAESGVLIEVSSAGLRKPVAEIYPAEELLRAFRAAGVAATAGSDAHAPDEVGADLDQVYDALAQAGYERVGLPRGGGEVRWYEL